MKKTLIQFGAGNIGRSFIGQIFSYGGYDIVFIDINDTIVTEINARKSYTVVIKQNDKKDIFLTTNNIRAIHASDTAAVIKEITAADLISTSVGKQALVHIIPTLSEGIKKRFSLPNASDLNIILAENMLNGKEIVSRMMKKRLGSFSHLLSHVGIIETSIGKMVPIMPEDVAVKDPLLVYAEPYSTLIIDKKAFLGPLPAIEDLKAVEPIKAYVDRKLFIHNLGHAAVSYLGYVANPEKRYLYEILEDQTTTRQVRMAMKQAAEALLKEYPDAFSTRDLDEHIDDLLYRFSNKALKDTVYRVGRDLRRKLNVDDRILGAITLCILHKLPFDKIAEVFKAGLKFRATDESGNRFPDDITFLEEAEDKDISAVVTDLCGLKNPTIIESMKQNIPV